MSSTAPFSVDDHVWGYGANEFAMVGPWDRAERDEPPAYYHGSTQSWCASPGCSAEISLKNASRITYYAVVAPHHGIAAVSVDNGQSVDVDLYASTKKGNVAVWTSGELGAGQHTLEIKYTGRANPLNTANDHVITLDRVEITPYVEKAVTTTGPPIGAIIGGVVGGVFLIALIVGFLLFRRRRQNSASQSTELQKLPTTHIEPPEKTDYLPPVPVAPLNYPAPAYSGEGYPASENAYPAPENAYPAPDNGPSSFGMDSFYAKPDGNAHPLYGKPPGN